MGLESRHIPLLAFLGVEYDTRLLLIEGAAAASRWRCLLHESWFVTNFQFGACRPFASNAQWNVSICDSKGPNSAILSHSWRKSFEANLLMILVSGNLIFRPSFSFILERANPVLLPRPFGCNCSVRRCDSPFSKPVASVSGVSSLSSFMGSSIEFQTPNDSPCLTSSRISGGTSLSSTP